MAGRPGSLFALLDGASLPGLHSRIERLGAPALCLFKGHAAHSLRDVAPWLLRLGAGDPPIAALLNNSTDPATDNDPLPGLLVQTDMALADLRTHFRRLMRVEASGQWYFFRFWDAPAARAYFDAIADAEDRGRWFFPREGGRIDALLVPDGGSPQFRAYRAGPTPPARPWLSRPFRLAAPELAALRSSRVSDGADQLVALMTSTFPELAARIGPGLFDSMVRRAAPALILVPRSRDN